MSKPGARQRLERLVAEYGVVAFGVWFGLFFVSIAGFSLAISSGVDVPKLLARLGFDPNGFMGKAGVLGLAWGATQLIKLPRLVATLALTPLVAKLLGRVKPPDAAAR